MSVTSDPILTAQPSAGSPVEAPLTLTTEPPRPLRFSGQLAMWGNLGISLFGILLICVGLADGLGANSNFNQQVIVHGYADRDHRSMHASDLHSATRFAVLVDTIGAALVAVGLGGFFWFG